jgi:hypothetical protein
MTAASAATLAKVDEEEEEEEEVDEEELLMSTGLLAGDSIPILGSLHGERGDINREFLIGLPETLPVRPVARESWFCS